MSEKKEGEEKPLIREVSTYPPPTDEDGLPKVPPPPRYERPPVPEINPLLVQALNQDLTLADCQYIINALPDHIVRNYEKIRKERPQQVIPASQQVREMQAAIDMMIQQVTKGYTVPYTPPTTTSSEHEEEGLSLNDLWELLNQINPELKEKAGKTIGKLFDMLNERLGAEKDGGYR